MSKPLRILIIDNYDSFVYNIIGLLGEIQSRGVVPDFEWRVVMNDAVDIKEAGEYDAIILSPGPGVPQEAGRMTEVLDKYVRCKPVFGVCLGFQGIAEYFGARLRQLPYPRHGHLSRLQDVDESDPLMGSLASGSAVVGRYHSWVVDEQTLPQELAATSFDEDGNLMSLRHRELPVFGTQFHPESIISDCGDRILEAFLKIAAGNKRI